MASTYCLNPTVTLERTNNPSSAKRQYLLSTNGRQYYVDGAVGDIVAGLQSNQDPDDIFGSVTRKFRITREAFDELLNVKLPAMGVLQSPHAAGKRASAADPESITFLFHLMPRALAGRLAGGAAALFSRPAAAVTLLAALGILAVALMTGKLSLFALESMIAAPASFSAAQYGQLYLIIFAAAVIHELGHLSAAKRFNCEIDRINVGAYLIFPVFYVNMSNTWKLSARQRIVVNLGGMYFQFIYTIALLLFAQYSASPLVLYAFYTSLYIILVNLNPFLKFDGYWVYGDYFDIINLRQQHLKLLGQFMHSAPGKWRAIYRAAWQANAGLAAYVVGATLFLAYFACMLAQFLLQFLVQFPAKWAELTGALRQSTDIWGSVDAFTHLSYQFFLLFALAMIARRTLSLLISAWRYGHDGARQQ